MNQENVTQYLRLIEIMDTLREKCPWDRKQTFDSLSHLTIEETYELCDAILEGDMSHIKEELGDLFLHLVFYAKLLNEKEGITIEDILFSINEKLVYRHPHVFGEETDLTEDEVKQNWEKLKLKEGRKSVLQGVGKSLPSVVKAFRIQEKAAQVGFDWENIELVKAKIEEEAIELAEALETGNLHEIEDELGDVLFSYINLARKLQIDPEQALQKTNQKFIKRFQYIENNSHKSIDKMTLDEMEKLWQEAK
jgi:XTP/dITP diphosphohydrolase